MKLFSAIFLLGLFDGSTQRHAAFASAAEQSEGDPGEPNGGLLLSTPTADGGSSRLRRGGGSLMTPAEKLSVETSLKEELLGGIEIPALSLHERAETLKRLGSKLEELAADIDAIDLSEFAEFEFAKSMSRNAGKEAIKRIVDAATHIEKAEQSKGDVVLHENNLQGKRGRRRRTQESVGNKQEGARSNQRRQQHSDPFDGFTAGGGADFSSFTRGGMPGGFPHVDDLVNSLLKGDLSGALKGVKGGRSGHHIGHGSRRLHGRSLANKQEQCDLLQECVTSMSTIDLFVYMYGDDLDPATGEIDPNIIRFDEADFFTKRNTIQGILDDLNSDVVVDYNTKCDLLLQQFHRSTEINGAPQWRGAMVNEVCHAEGSTVNLKLAEISRTIIGGLSQEGKPGYGQDFLDGCWPHPGGTGWPATDTAEWEEDLMYRIECVDTCSPAYAYAGWIPDLSMGRGVCWCRDVPPSSSSCAGAGGSFEVYPTTSRLPSLMYSWYTDAMESELGLILNEIVAEPFNCAREMNPAGSSDPFPLNFGDHYLMCVGGSCTENDGFDDDADSLHEFRCCSSEDAGAGWEQVNGCTSTWTLGRVSGVCGGLVKRTVAASLCRIGGGRLCTSMEVEQGCARGTDCPLPDPERIWTIYDGLEQVSNFIYDTGIAYDGPESSIGSQDFQYVSCGFGDVLGECDESNGFVASSELRGVRCCTDDEDLPGEWIRKDQCSVWAESLCDGFKSFQDAEAACAAAGARLCTREEMQAGCTQGTGCSFDKYLNWVTTSSFSQYRMPIGIDPSSCGTTQARDCHGQLQNNDLDQGLLFTHVADILAELDSHVCEEQFAETWDECFEEGNSQLLAPFENFMSDCLFPRYLEAFAACHAEVYAAFDTGLELVFGSDVSPGYICGIRNAVVDEGKSLPGSCCLDAPYQLNGELWGSQYDCSQPCQQLGPFFAGMSADGCSIYGGTWCPTPADCTILKDCVVDLTATSVQENLPAFQAYLSLMPAIIDPTNQNECGPAREYFGFDEHFINDQQICDDVSQLRLSRTFDWLETFFMQGDGEASPVEDHTDGVEIEEIAAAEPEFGMANIRMVELPEGTIEEPDRAASTHQQVQDGVAWSSTNYALQQTADGAGAVFEAAQAVDCGGSIAAIACAGVKNAVTFPLLAALVIADIALSISEFTYGQVAEWGNVAQIELVENSAVIQANMQSTADWMRDSFNTLVANQQSMFDTNKMNLEASVELLATLEGQNNLGNSIGNLATLAGQNSIKAIVEDISMKVNSLAETSGTRRALLLSDGKTSASDTDDRITVTFEGEIARTVEEVTRTTLEKVKNDMLEEMRGEFQEQMKSAAKTKAAGLVQEVKKKAIEEEKMRGEYTEGMTDVSSGPNAAAFEELKRAMVHLTTEVKAIAVAQKTLELEVRAAVSAGLDETREELKENISAATETNAAALEGLNRTLAHLTTMVEDSSRHREN